MLLSGFVVVGWVFFSLVYTSSLDFQRVHLLSVACFLDLFADCLLGHACWGNGREEWKGGMGGKS